MARLTRVVTVVAIFALIVSPVAAADYYKLQGVKRIDQDLYKSSDGLYIETQYCYHYSYGENALLKWEFEGSIGNKVIWADDSTCTVKRLLRK
jgi:hypothetical protein